MHKIKRILVTFVLLLLPNGINAESSGDWQILPGERIGKITPNTSESDLRKMYGEGNVSEVEAQLGEGFTEKGTILFPNDSNKSLQILWKDKIKKQFPARIQWTGESSVWQTSSGIKLGARLKEIEKWNGKPFKLTGFGWDYGGTVTSWDGGALQVETSQGGRLIVRLSEPKNAKLSSKERDSVLGDREFLSSNPVMKKLNPTVYQIVFEVGR